MTSFILSIFGTVIKTAATYLAFAVLFAVLVMYVIFDVLTSLI